MTNVIQIGDFRFARRPRHAWRGDGSACQHNHMTIDDHGDVITCDDCGKQLGATWVLRNILDDYAAQFELLRSRTQELQELTSKEIVLIAARKVESAWRKRDTVPACPHCSRGILATDRFGATQVSKRMEQLRREREKEARSTSP